MANSSSLDHHSRFQSEIHLDALSDAFGAKGMVSFATVYSCARFFFLGGGRKKPGGMLVVDMCYNDVQQKPVAFRCKALCTLI